MYIYIYILYSIYLQLIIDNFLENHNINKKLNQGIKFRKTWVKRYTKVYTVKDDRWFRKNIKCNFIKIELIIRD